MVMDVACDHRLLNASDHTFIWLLLISPFVVVLKNTSCSGIHAASDGSQFGDT